MYRRKAGYLLLLQNWGMVRTASSSRITASLSSLVRGCHDSWTEDGLFIRLAE
jgi:hypothetical protein